MRPTGQQLYEPHRRLRVILGPVFGAACLLATLTGVLVLSLLLGALVVAVIRSRPAGPGYGWTDSIRQLVAFFERLLTSRSSSDPARTGFQVGIVGTLWLLGLVASCSIPVGVGTAIYLEEFAGPGRFRRLIQMNIANLAGVPSIVYGILGLSLFVRAFGFAPLALGPTLWAGGLTLSLLVLPVIIIATQEALRTVPSSHRQAALALGATRWQMVRDHVLPSALPGILTGTILGLSRAIGETAPLLMVGAAGAILRLPRGPGDRYTALPVEIYNDAKEPAAAFQSVAAGGILILLSILLTMNAMAIIIRQRSGRQRRS